MKITPSPALFMRRFIDKLHPAFITTPRESQKLLATLNKSFKQQLDAVYPSPQTSGPSPAIPGAPAEAAGTSGHATETHFGSILSHPLFEGSISQPKADHVGPENALAIFNDADTRGQVDLQLIRRCVRIYRETPFSRDKRFADRLAAWVSSPSCPLRESFLTDVRLFPLTTPMMYQSGREEQVWEWLRMLYKREFGVQKVDVADPKRVMKWLDAEDTLIATMMEEAWQRYGASAAVQQFVQANKHRSESSNVITSLLLAPTEDATTLPLLLRSERLICGRMLGRKEKHGVPEDMFDELVKAISRGPLTQLTAACIPIYHPSQPDPLALYEKVRSEDGNSTLTMLATSRPGRLLLLSIIDGAQMLHDRNMTDKARVLLSFVEKHFPGAEPPLKQKSLSARILSARRRVPHLTPNVFGQSSPVVFG